MDSHDVSHLLIFLVAVCLTIVIWMTNISSRCVRSVVLLLVCSAIHLYLVDAITRKHFLSFILDTAIRLETRPRRHRVNFHHKPLCFLEQRRYFWRGSARIYYLVYV